MEGKSLAMAYSGDPSDGDTGDSGAGADIIKIDFRGMSPASPVPPAAGDEALFAPLDQFLIREGDVQWHDAAGGLAAVRSILAKLRAGAAVTAAPDFMIEDDEGEELAERVRYDLEELEQMLVAAQKARIKFHLTFDV